MPGKCLVGYKRAPRDYYWRVVTLISLYFGWRGGGRSLMAPKFLIFEPKSGTKPDMCPI